MLDRKPLGVERKLQRMGVVVGRRRIQKTTTTVPLSKKTLGKIRHQYMGDPWRWQREMEAEWCEDEDCYLPLSLITNCIDSDLEYTPFEARIKGRFYIGVDLGKKRDFSVVAAFEEVEGECSVQFVKFFSRFHTPVFPTL